MISLYVEVHKNFRADSGNLIRLPGKLSPDFTYQLLSVRRSHDFKNFSGVAAQLDAEIRTAKSHFSLPFSGTTSLETK